jgi:hypothetical protein
MKITRRQLRRIIKEATEPMTHDYVLGALTNNASVRSGVPFIRTAMDGIMTSDYRAAANAVMDALMIDDPPEGAEEELEDLLVTAKTEDDIAAIGSEWGTRHFRTRPSAYRSQ